MSERIKIWIAWHLPRSIAMWAFIRVASAGTVGKYSDQIVPELTVTEALTRWTIDASAKDRLRAEGGE